MLARLLLHKIWLLSGEEKGRAKGQTDCSRAFRSKKEKKSFPDATAEKKGKLFGFPSGISPVAFFLFGCFDVKCFNFFPPLVSPLPQKQSLRGIP